MRKRNDYSLMAVAAAFIAAGLAGCTMIPFYHQPQAPVSSTFPQGGVYATQPGTDGRALNGRSADGVVAADIGWRNFFIDPRLQQLVEIALKNNRDLRVAVLNIEASRAQYQITRANLLPSVGAVGTGTIERYPMLTDNGNPAAVVGRVYNVGLSASWELDFFGRLRSLKEQALSQYLATAEARKAEEILLVSQVADQYLTMLADDDLLKVTAETLKTAQASYNLTKLQFENGTSSELDLRQAQTVVETAQANMQAQLRARAQAENALVLLIGEPLPADLAPGLPLDSQNLLADVPAGLPSDLLIRRPDIMEAEQQLLAANANIGAARAAFFPRVMLTGAFGTASITLGDLFKPGMAAWTFMPQITLPIFSGGANLANLNLANIEKKVQIAQYEKAIQSAFREVADGLAARGTYDQQVAAQQRDVEANQRRFDLSDLRYRNGVDSYLSVLTAQTDLYAAQQALIAARLARLTNLVDLYRALGGGWIEHNGDAPRSPDAPDYASAASAASEATVASAASAASASAASAAQGLVPDAAH